jgi:hypothetical protein
MKGCLKYGSMLLWSVIFSLCLCSCVDTDSGTIPTVDLRTSTKFVNLSNLGGMNVTVDGGAVASVNYELATDYLSLATGVRTFVFAYGSARDTLITALGHDSKCSIFSVYDPLNGDSARGYYLAYERRTYAGTEPYTPHNAFVRFLNFSRDTTATSISFKITDTVAATPDILQSAMGYTSSTPYYQVDIGGLPRFTVYNRYRDTLASQVALTEGRYSVVLFGNKQGSTLKVNVYKED